LIKREDIVKYKSTTNRKVWTFKQMEDRKIFMRFTDWNPTEIRTKGRLTNRQTDEVISNL